MGAMTTIRVGQGVRDRLAALADAHGRSLGAELEAILDDLAWQAIGDGYKRLAADPAALADYQAEAAVWIAPDVDSLAADAAEEYPEYNAGPR
jgi:plasmid stability protein